jgi:hypothetical protein
MPQSQKSWVRSQHPPTHWNLRSGRWSSVTKSTYEKISKNLLVKAKNLPYFIKWRRRTPHTYVRYLYVKSRIRIQVICKSLSLVDVTGCVRREEWAPWAAPSPLPHPPPRLTRHIWVRSSVKLSNFYLFLTCTLKRRSGCVEQVL